MGDRCRFTARQLVNVWRRAGMMSLWYYTPARTAVPGVLEYDIRAPSAAEDEACYNLRLDSKLKEKRTQDSALCLAEDNFIYFFLFLKFLLIVCDILVGLHIFTTKKSPNFNLLIADPRKIQNWNGKLHWLPLYYRKVVKR